MADRHSIKRKRIKSRRSFLDRLALFVWQAFASGSASVDEDQRDMVRSKQPSVSSMHIDMRHVQTPREQLGEDMDSTDTEHEIPALRNLEIKTKPVEHDLDLQVDVDQNTDTDKKEEFWLAEPSQVVVDEARTEHKESIDWNQYRVYITSFLRHITLLWAQMAARLIVWVNRCVSRIDIPRELSWPHYDMSSIREWMATVKSRLVFNRRPWDNIHDQNTDTMAGSNTSSKKQSFAWRWIKRLFFFGVIVFFLLGGIFFIWVATLEIPENNIDERIVAQSTKIYDTTGEVLLYDVFKDERRTVVPLAEISPNMVKAIMAIEDDHFYEHNGVRPMAIVRAVYYKLRDPSSRLQGGSTITQQTIKNALLTNDRRIERKIKEIVLAWRLERVKTKDEIMELYLNEIPFGGPIYGVEQAALSFFGISASELSLAESSYLAALPKAPTTYLNDRERFDGRAAFIINRMKELGFISAAEYEQAINEQVEFVERVDRGIKAPHFVFYTLEQLDEELTQEEELNFNGYRIRTTLDWELQTALEDVVATHTARISENYEASNLALVVLENKTGKIRAMVGSKDYFAEDIDGKFNITTAYRQPGSTFKPFVYAQAMRRGYTPDTVLWDTPTEFSQSCFPDGEPRNEGDEDVCYQPNNYDLSFRGPINLRNALAQSLNIPAVKLLYLVGVGESMELARNLGISSLNKAPSFYGLNLVLGGGEVRMIDMALAYSTFANNGYRHELAAWDEVTDAEGVVLDVYEDYQEQVLEQEVAAMINDILSDNDAKRPMFGTYSRLYYEDGRDVAVKTGTTNNYRDVWTAGYSSDVTVVVWAGNNDNTPIGSAPSSSVVGPFWRDAMDVALEAYPSSSFASYTIEEYEDLKPVLRGNYEGGGLVYVDPETDEVIDNPTEEEIQSGVYELQGSIEYHSILHHVDRRDVRGPAPINPEQDGLYEHFEYGLAAWLVENEWAEAVASGTINDLLEQIKEAEGGDSENTNTPLVVDQQEEDFDFVITSPQGGAVVDGSRRTEIEIATVGDVREIETIYYYLNNTYLESGGYRNTSTQVQLGNVRGVEDENTIKVIVEKTDGTRIERNTTVYVQ